MPYVNHPLGRTYFRSKGKGKRPIIFLHGGPGGTSSSMKGFLDLSKNRKVFIYDQLGAGKSSKTTSEKWNIKTFVDELRYLIDAWGLEEFDLAGASWGTTLALEYYLRTKDKRIKSLIFQSPMFSAKDWENDGKRLIRNLPAQTQKVLRYCHEIGATDSKVYQKAMYEFYLKHVLRSKKKLKEFFENPSSMNLELYQYMWGPSEFKPTGTLGRYDRNKDLHKIKVPTLIVCGEFDEATPKTGIKYAKKIKGAEFVEIKGASHAIVFEKKKKLLSTIESFLKSY